METNEQNFCHYSGLPSPMAYAEEIGEESTELTLAEIDRVIEMAWEDRTPFDAIQMQFGLNEAAVKLLMKQQLKFSSYRLWRNRVKQCSTKHSAKRNENISRFKSNLQRNITQNKISKR